MSTHRHKTFHNGGEVEVTLGWDRAIGYFYMTVMVVENEDDIDFEFDEEDDLDEDSSIIYSNLDDGDKAFSHTLDEYREILKNLGIEVPESMFEETLRDKEGDVGNRDVTHV